MKEHIGNVLIASFFTLSMTLGAAIEGPGSANAQVQEATPSPTPTINGDLPPIGPEYSVYAPLIANGYEQPEPTATPTLIPPWPPESPTPTETPCHLIGCEPTPTLKPPSNK
jgi:hypothetical protein